MIQTVFLSQCSTGDTSDEPSNKFLNPTCICQLINTCNTDGQLTIYLNRSKKIGVEAYTAGLRSALAKMDMSCGAMPVGPNPNNFSLGKRCSNDMDCGPSRFPKCERGSSCRCCANINITCSEHSDCHGYEKDSFCGCTIGGTGICGPFFDVITGKPVLYDMSIGSYPRNIQVEIHSMNLYLERHSLIFKGFVLEVGNLQCLTSFSFCRLCAAERNTLHLFLPQQHCSTNR
jgi:hypothetical protein